MALERYDRLKEKIEKEPITKKDFFYIMKKDVERIWAVNIPEDVCLITWDKKYKIGINSQRSLETQKRTLIH